MHVRTRGTARGADVGQRVATRHGLAHTDGQAAIVAIAGDQAVAMADLDEVAIAGLLARESDDASSHGDHVRTLGTGEIDALVEGLVTREGILPLTEIGGNVPVSHRAAIRPDLLIELFR